MSKRLENNKEFLLFLSKANKKQRQLLLESATPQQIKAVTECTINVCAGNVPLTPRQFTLLKKHKKGLHKFIAEKTFNCRRKLIQKGGFLPILISAIAPIIGTIIETFIREAITK
jgi:hypothetical protein